MRRPSLRFSNLLGEHWLIVSILFAFLILASCYSIVTPVFEAPDEPAHYFYIKYVVDTRSLPVITGDDYRGALGQRGASTPSLLLSRSSCNRLGRYQ